MIVSKEKALNLACVVLHAGNCLAEDCMAWKWKGISKDTGCCGLVYSNVNTYEDRKNTNDN